MNKATLSWICIIILVIGNLILIYMLNKYNSAGVVKPYDDTYVKDVMSDVNKHLLIDGAELKNIILYEHVKKKKKTPKQDSIFSYDLLKGENIVFYYSKLFCSNCVLKQFDKLNKLSNKIDNIIILTDEIVEKYADYILYNNIKPKVYETKFVNIGLSKIIDNPENPQCIYMLIRDGKIITSYILSQETLNYVDDFYAIFSAKWRPNK